jgi:hypothetical protein
LIRSSLPSEIKTLEIWSEKSKFNSVPNTSHIDQIFAHFWSFKSNSGRPFQFQTWTNLHKKIMYNTPPHWEYLLAQACILLHKIDSQTHDSLKQLLLAVKITCGAFSAVKIIENISSALSSAHCSSNPSVFQVATDTSRAFLFNFNSLQTFVWERPSAKLNRNGKFWISIKIHQWTSILVQCLVSRLHICSFFAWERWQEL